MITCLDHYERKKKCAGYLDQAFQSVRQKQILHFSKSSVINQSGRLQTTNSRNLK